MLIFEHRASAAQVSVGQTWAKNWMVQEWNDPFMCVCVFVPFTHRSRPVLIAIQVLFEHRVPHSSRWFQSLGFISLMTNWVGTPPHGKSTRQMQIRDDDPIKNPTKSHSKPQNSRGFSSLANVAYLWRKSPHILQGMWDSDDYGDSPLDSQDGWNFSLSCLSIQECPENLGILGCVSVFFWYSPAILGVGFDPQMGSACYFDRWDLRHRFWAVFPRDHPRIAKDSELKTGEACVKLHMIQNYYAIF